MTPQERCHAPLRRSRARRPDEAYGHARLSPYYDFYSTHKASRQDVFGEPERKVATWILQKHLGPMSQETGQTPLGFYARHCAWPPKEVGVAMTGKGVIEYQCCPKYSWR